MKVDTMLTHIQIKMQLGWMPPFNKLPTKLYIKFCSWKLDAVFNGFRVSDIAGLNIRQYQVL